MKPTGIAKDSAVQKETRGNCQEFASKQKIQLYPGRDRARIRVCSFLTKTLNTPENYRSDQICLTDLHHQAARCAQIQS
jgi:hypothetical protein